MVVVDWDEGGGGMMGLVEEGRPGKRVGGG